ncbi:Spo11/DNA topoisomerase VI subunit A [Flammula alnicola]|nr:Spo11/DNA topoisomerase VI subunit A [Flammula alnicola]
MVLSFLRQLATPGISNVEDRSSDQSDTTDASLSRNDYKIEIPLVDRKRADLEGNSAMKVLRYPKKSNSGSSRPFAQLFRVLDLAHEATLSGVPATKRDIYYKDVPLFKTQKVVDMLVDDIAATFELERSDLNIRSSSKGVVCGSGLTMKLFSGETICCNDVEGTLVPAGEDIESFSVDEDVAWVLVVEKEASLLILKILYFFDDHITFIFQGKGYPDVATRHIVKSLADALPRSIPVMALVDGDPYGLDILSVYKYGSKGMQHENGKLAARRIKWLGLWASELESLGIDKDHLLPITEHDEKKALSMLLRPRISLPARWKKEMQYMLHSRHKAEIEILSSVQSNYKAASHAKLPLSNARIDSMGSKQNETNISCPEDLLHDDIDLPSADAFDCSLYAPLGSDASEFPDPSGSFNVTSERLCAPHALLLRYLELKITDFVVSARRRTAG